MRRLNPDTGKPFKRGEYRKDGWVFYGYEKQKLKRNGFFPERWADPFIFTIEKAFQSSRSRAKKKKLPFNLDVKYLQSIYTKDCPIFKQPMTWGNLGVGKNIYSPSLDRIIPALGYVKGNVAFISDKANRIKAEFEAKDLYAVADWVHEISKGIEENVKAFATAPVSTRYSIQGELYPELGIVSTTGTGQNDDHPHHHCGADAGQDTDHCAKTGGGDGMGHRGQEMGTLSTPKSQQDNGNAPSPVIWP